MVGLLLGQLAPARDRHWLARSDRPVVGLRPIKADRRDRAHGLLARRLRISDEMDQLDIVLTGVVVIACVPHDAIDVIGDAGPVIDALGSHPHAIIAVDLLLDEAVRRSENPTFGNQRAATMVCQLPRLERFKLAGFPALEVAVDLDLPRRVMAQCNVLRGLRTLGSGAGRYQQRCRKQPFSERHRVAPRSLPINQQDIVLGSWGQLNMNSLAPYTCSQLTKCERAARAGCRISFPA